MGVKVGGWSGGGMPMVTLPPTHLLGGGHVTCVCACVDAILVQCV